MKGYKSFFRFIHDSYQKEEGAVVVIVALSMVVLLGFSALAIDMGFAYNKASDLQNALDSAALAAVQELPADNTTSQEWASAVSEGITYASLNDISISEDAILPVYKNDDVNNIIIGVKVNGKKDVPYHFAQVLGFDKMTISRSATAELKTVKAMSGIAPLCCSKKVMENIYEGKEVTLKQTTKIEDNNDDFYNMTGWYGALRIDGNGANDYRDALAGGSKSKISEGQVIDVKNGNMAGPTDDGYNMRINGHEGCTFENHEENCKRILIIPLVEQHSKKEVKVIGFASFFLDNCENKGTITAKYIKTIVSGSASAGPSADYGVYVPKLTE